MRESLPVTMAGKVVTSRACKLSKPRQEPLPVVYSKLLNLGLLAGSVDAGDFELRVVIYEAQKSSVISGEER